MHHDGVTRLVIGDGAALLIFHHTALLLHAAGEGLFNRFLEIFHRDRLMVVAHSQDRRFIYDVGKIRADQPGGGLGNIHQIDIRSDATILNVDLKNG